MKHFIKMVQADSKSVSLKESIKHLTHQNYSENKSSELTTGFASRFEFTQILFEVFRKHKHNEFVCRNDFVVGWNQFQVEFRAFGVDFAEVLIANVLTITIFELDHEAIHLWFSIYTQQKRFELQILTFVLKDSLFKPKFAETKFSSTKKILSL